MLNQRQIEILLEFFDHPDEYLTGSYFAEKLGVSLRTIQGDMKEIRNELEEETCAKIVSKVSKGSRIEIQDYDEFSAFVNSLYQQYTTVSLNYPISRISKMLLMLLNRHRAISISEMEEKFYVSKSTILNDLKKVEEILDKYNLELMRGNNKVMVDGFEIHKRRCLSEQDLYIAHIRNEHGMLYIEERQLAKIKNILTEIFVEHKYHIMDSDFNNAILFMNIMICRMADGFYIQSNELDYHEELNEEYEISKAVLEKISRRFFIKFTQEEVLYFALFLKGIGNSTNEDAIPAEISQLIDRTLEKIKGHFNMDLTDNVNLKISLALHCISLSVRIQYDMQVKNDMKEYIRESFPLGYDIGAYFAYQLAKEYGKKVTEDEIALLAVHFYSSLLDNKRNTNKKKILVISSLKNSMTVLLKQTLHRWFSEYVSAVDFADPLVAEEEAEDFLDEYDIFLTTEKGKFFDMGLAMYVNAFPKESDYRNIKLNIDGFKNIEDVVSIFRPELFQVATSGKKEKILEEVCTSAEEYFFLDDLYDEVLQREGIGSTFFTKDIAVPHPMNAVSSDTFVSTYFTKKPVQWDEEGNKVNLVMLLHVGKNNTQAFQMWEYFSKIFASKNLVEQLIADPTYENFIELIKQALREGINSSEV